jgi:ubiquinone/menaquinone biosynthesis C-methylase UbiE
VSPVRVEQNLEAAVGFYSRVVFPRLCNFVLDNPRVARHRRELLAHADGDILEIGFGTGLNLPCYPKGISRITVVEPNAGMNRLAKTRIQQTGIEIDQRLLGGERLPFEAGTFDCVVSTFTLCSIAQVHQALGEVYRVLKSGGRFLFLEHGLCPEPKVQKWQRRLNGLWQLVADGCRLDRNIKELITAQPFAAVESAELYLEKAPRTHGYIYRGTATK